MDEIVRCKRLFARTASVFVRMIPQIMTSIWNAPSQKLRNTTSFYITIVCRTSSYAKERRTWIRDVWMPFANRLPQRTQKHNCELWERLRIPFTGFPVFMEKFAHWLQTEHFTFPKKYFSPDSLKCKLTEASPSTVDKKHHSWSKQTPPTQPLVTLNLRGHEMGFFSRILSSTDQNCLDSEKKIYIVVESVRNWPHYALETHLKLIKDQSSVDFKHKMRISNKMKNKRIQRWHNTLS